MTSKLRVRELSAELGVANKDLLHFLREHNIQVKSHMSGLDDQAVKLVREKFTAEQKQTSSQKQKTSSGVIIRRRQSKKEPPVQEQEEKRKEKETSSAARHMPVKEPAQAKEEPTPKEEAKKPKPAEKGLEADMENRSLDQVQPGSEKEKETSTKPKKRKRPKKRKKEPEKPKVTVISRPKEEDEEKVEAQKPAEEEQKPVEEKPKEEEQKPPSKKKKKDKRTVDVSGLYEEKDHRKNKVEWKQKKSSEVKDKTGGKIKQKRRHPQAREQKPKPAQMITQPTKAAKRKIRIEEAIRVAELAQEMGVKAQDIIKSLMDLGIMATINQSLDIDTASVLAAEYGYEVEKTGFSEEEFILPQKEDKPEDLQIRPPVVTIMGHVDHGKTSLLDSIRKSHIIDKEAGGITQHIGAYHVNTPRGAVVFLDTPGHEAFTEMRSRGAQVTDIVILIVAADDGVMDQTKEAINHAKAANVPIVVAINKIDKDNADPDRVKRELAENGLLPEDWGGETIFCYISAKKGQGLDELLEMLVLQTDILELKANPNKRARGHIIEARLDKGRGPVATVLVQEGRLLAADPFVCGLYNGKVRALLNDRGHKIDEAGPSMPVEVQGFEGVPQAGDEFVVVENEKVAKRISEERQTKHREKELAKETKVTLESFFAAKAEEEVKTLHLILKADVQGSLEAISEAIQKLNTDAVKVQLIHEGIGAISESDIKLAAASSAIIIGFNVKPTSKVKDIAEQEGIEIRFYDVIYQLVNDVKEAMAGMLAPITKEVYLGQAEVRDTFSVPKVGTVAGCYVLDGKLQRNAGIRLLREGVVQYTGKLSSLKRFKDDVKEVFKEYECGVGLEKFNDIKVGDIIEVFEEIQERAKLD